ncbi:thioredoxin-like protein [Kockovaella imperatae]|uniref:Thioredoxin-like protein n=1 Tax=Kockovaella imperatae TaxID=4999 RepID=A0A1Y1UDZ0_9TREE|nr:thioredoxin-like protein [Kockovaella imperatae]ORX36253.1 thioredoxin-like protein [Kockovaella imperatae]
MSFMKKLPASLREIRILICQTSPGSAGVRQYVASQYPSIKSAHPDLKFLVREARGIPARAIARFDGGYESELALDGVSAEAVGDRLRSLVENGK